MASRRPVITKNSKSGSASTTSSKRLVGTRSRDPRAARRLSAEKEIDRPAARHVPRRFDCLRAGEPPPRAARDPTSQRPARSRSPAEIRQHFLAEEPDLLVSVGAHSSSMTCVHPPRGTPRSLRCTPRACRRSACSGRAGRRSPAPSRASRPPRSIASATGASSPISISAEFEQRVRRALDVLELVREVHAADLPGAVAARVAIGLVDRRDRRCSRCRSSRITAGFVARCRPSSARSRAS